MMRALSLSCLLSATVLLANCTEVTAPNIQGRWAAAGIQLAAEPLTIVLQLPCDTKGQVPRTFLSDSPDMVRFSTRVIGPHGTAYAVDFLGQFRGDTLAVTLTSTFLVGEPLVQTYAMVPNGDPAFGSFICLA
jgi:hypothetical protein